MDPGRNFLPGYPGYPGTRVPGDLGLRAGTQGACTVHPGDPVPGYPGNLTGYPYPGTRVDLPFYPGTGVSGCAHLSHRQEC
eukprot:3030517-Rhodomonas_salina.1